MSGWPRYTPARGGVSSRSARRDAGRAGRHRGAGARQGWRAADDRRLAGARRPRLPVTSVLLVGAGAVGTRAGRQLVDTPDVERVLIADRSSQRALFVADALGPKAEPAPWPTDEMPD